MAQSKRSSRQWRVIDVIITVAFLAFILIFLAVFTSLGDSLSASSAGYGRVSIPDPKRRQQLVEMMEAGEKIDMIEVCSGIDVDHMPCEDPRRNSQLSRVMNYYRERHCPVPDEMPICLLPPPSGYKIRVSWPESLHKIWHSNMPYNKIADRKGHQGWMKVEGEYFLFPGGGTMFPGGAEEYIEKLSKYIPLKSGTLRTALDMGCGVASFGGTLLAEGILALSFAPRDSHKAQIQFALERGVPAFVSMLGTHRLPFPASSFDFMHCSRCLIPYTAYDASYFIEVDRLLRRGGFLVISGPPVRWSKQEKEWADLQAVATALCYELVTVDGNTAIWMKPVQDSCLVEKNKFGLKFCDEADDPSYAWYYKLKKCVSRSIKGEDAIGVIPKWPERLTKAPSRALTMKIGTDEFEADTSRWSKAVANYKNSLNVKLGTPAIRNIMDMNALFGGFAAALASDPVWVMNVVPSHNPASLGVIYDRGLIGVYHDWCEPFSTYPRTYDLIHVVNIESLIKHSGSNKNRCSLIDLLLEMDRILRPEGTVVICDSVEVIEKVHRVAEAVRWTSTIYESALNSKNRKERVLIATKTFWKLASHSH